MPLSRREVMGGALLMASPELQAATPKLAPIVLVHGAWHGGWCWRRVETALRALGHPVFTPTLTGLADRAHLLTREVNLSTHVADVCGVLEVEELSKAILVGHSYGGLVVTGAAARLGSRLTRLVYLDAFVPTSGQAGFELMRAGFSDSWKKAAAERGDGFKVPPMLDAKAMGITDPADAAWVDKKLTPHPLAAMAEKLDFDEAAVAKVPRAFIHCGGFGGFGPTAERVRKQGFDVKQLPCGHDAMVISPEPLAQMLHGWS